MERSVPRITVWHEEACQQNIVKQPAFKTTKHKESYNKQGINYNKISALFMFPTYCRIIEALDDLAHKFNLARKRTARFSRNYVVAEIWQQTSSDDTLTVGISLGNNTDDVIDKDLIKSVNNGSEVDVNITDVAIYLPENVVRGKIER